VSGEIMEKLNLKIVELKENKSLKRKELKVLVEHPNKGTPAKDEIRDVISKKFNTSPENVIIRKIESEYGLPKSWIFIRIYDDRKTLEEVEPEYILRRNFKVKEEKGEE